jgi:hypothetical protein
MATVLYLRDKAENALGANYLDLEITAGSGAASTTSVATTAGGTEHQFGGGSNLIWVTPKLAAGFTLTTGSVSIWLHESNMAANIGGRVRVFKRTAAGVESELGGGPFNFGTEMNVTTAREDVWTTNVTDTAFAEDDRIMLKVYITNVGTMASGHTGVISWNASAGATGDSFFSINEDVTFKGWAGPTPITASGGSYALTGTAATPKVARKVVANGDSYALTGADATFRKGLKIVAAGGSYALTGQDVTFRRTYILGANGGSYSLTGTDASLERGREVVADAGSYSLSGQDVTFDRTYVLTAGAGSYALTGTAVSLELGREVAADGGSYALTGQDVTFDRTYNIVAEGGSYSLTGTDASLEHGWKISAAGGSYLLTGADVTLTLESNLENKTIAADAGSYALSGQDVTFDRTYILTANAGSYALTGTNASLEVGFAVDADGGSYELTGTDADLRHDRKLTAEGGSYALTGTDVDFSIVAAPPQNQVGGGGVYIDRDAVRKAAKGRKKRREDEYAAKMAARAALANVGTGKAETVAVEIAEAKDFETDDDVMMVLLLAA